MTRRANNRRRRDGSATLPGSYGYAGQRADAATARYYVRMAGQFTSADTVLPGDGMDVWGLSRCAYVGGNPELRTDPLGRDWFSNVFHAVASVAAKAAPIASAVLDAATGKPSPQTVQHVWINHDTTCSM